MLERLGKASTIFFTLLLMIRLTGIVGYAATVRPAARLWQTGTETEPNDTPAQANPIAVNETLTGVIPAANPSDIDYFVLDTEPGRQYEVRLAESPSATEYQFRLALYDGMQNLVRESTTQGGDTSLTWTAVDTTYYFSVQQTEIGLNDATYEIRVVRFPVTPTATSPPGWDRCEINDTLTGVWSSDVPPGGPCPVSVGALIEDLNFVPFPGQPSPNPDFYLVSVKAGHNYQMETRVSAGVDTVAYLYLPGATDLGAYIDVNDDAAGLGLGSRIRWTPPADGSYIIRVENREPLPHDSDETYDLIIIDITATATPTSTPGTSTPTPPPVVIPGTPDGFEPNYDFALATLIGLGAKYTNLNFVPLSGTSPDNDFYKLWVVPGKIYTCETADLGAATNTNMIFYSCPDQSCGFAGNNDVEPFDPDMPYRSRITFFSTYEGYLYILLGQVGADKILPQEWSKLSYSLHCFIDEVATATPTPTSEFVPTPPQATPLPTATPEPGQPILSPTPREVIVVPMTTPTPPATPAITTPAPQVFVINVLIYFDENQNFLPDTGEGIRDVQVRVFDAVTGDLVAVDFTDETGQVRFVVPGQGPLRVSIPFFGFDQIVTEPTTDIQIRIGPNP
jgi:hypothetical protein